jgi:pseudaminic acid cytidylyltransferase
MAVIPARGGSKRIPRKNIRNFAGKPMIAHTIGFLKEMETFDRIIVSTDDKEISEVANYYGAETPFIRDATISGDHTGVQEVVADACVKLRQDLQLSDQVTCVFPCTPLLERDDMSKFLKISDENPGSFVFPVVPLRVNPARALVRKQEQTFMFKFPENRYLRTQDFEQLYMDSGQFYIASVSNWISNNLNDFRCEPLEPWKTVDIDNLEDWNFAERLFLLSIQDFVGGKE